MCSLKDYILANHTIEQIIADFREMFPPYVSNPSDAVITRYIETTFCNVPNGIVNCSCGNSGDDCVYTMFLYALAHNLTYFSALGTASLIPSLPRLVSSKSADGLKISYEKPANPTDPTYLQAFFSLTPYGMMFLQMISACGLLNSPGGFVV